MRIFVEPDPPALYVVYDRHRRVAQFETREDAEAFVGSERHEAQHRHIAETLAAYEAAPKRTGADRAHRKELGKKAWWALSFHVRAMHGPLRSHAPFLGKTYAEVEAWHARRHEEAS